MADINLATCFQYENPANGDMVVQASAENYIALIGNKVCSQESRLTIFQNALASMGKRLVTIENESTETYTLPSIKPIGIADPNVALPLDTFTQELEKQFSYQRNAVGNQTEIFDTIAAITGLNTSKSLGSSGGTLSTLPDWVSNVKTLCDFVFNQALMIQDLRSAVRNMQLSCCTGSCNSVEISLQTNYATRILTLIFGGTIPDNLINDGPGWRVKIEDFSGNYVYQTVDIKANLNVTSGVSIDLTSSNLNFADDLKVSGVYSLKDDTSGAQCQKYLEKIISNQTSCPILTVTPGFTDISVSFTHVEGSLTYSVQLYDINNSMLQSQQFSVSGAYNVQAQFTGLSVATPYKVRIEMITADSSRLCPFTITQTLANLCPAPNAVTATLEY